jgi:hypothetical protein
MVDRLAVPRLLVRMKFGDVSLLLFNSDDKMECYPFRKQTITLKRPNWKIKGVENPLRFPPIPRYKCNDGQQKKRYTTPEQWLDYTMELKHSCYRPSSTHQP